MVGFKRVGGGGGEAKNHGRVDTRYIYVVLLRRTGGVGEDTSHRFDFYTQPTEKLARLCHVNVAKMANRQCLCKREGGVRKC